MNMKQKRWVCLTMIMLLVISLQPFTAQAAAGDTEVYLGSERQEPVSSDPYADFSLRAWLSYSDYTSEEMVITGMRTRITNYNEDHDFTDAYFSAEDMNHRVKTDDFGGSWFLNGPIPAGAVNFDTEVDWEEVCDYFQRSNTFVIGDDFMQTHIGVMIERYIWVSPFYYFFETNWFADSESTRYVVG